MIGEIAKDSEDHMTLHVEDCELCSKEHTTRIETAEVMHTIEGRVYPYWTRCPNTNTVMALRSCVGQNIAAAYLATPLDPKK